MSTDKENVKTPRDALLAALSGVNACREDEQVEQAHVWKFAEDIGGYGWNVTYSRAVGLDRANRWPGREASIQKAAQVVTDEAMELVRGEQL